MTAETSQPVTCGAVNGLVVGIMLGIYIAKKRPAFAAGMLEGYTRPWLIFGRNHDGD